MKTLNNLAIGVMSTILVIIIAFNLIFTLLGSVYWLLTLTVSIVCTLALWGLQKGVMECE